jgi:hypothetical protein
MYGPGKTQRDCRLASTTKSNRSTIISRLHRLLLIFRTKLLKDSTTVTRSYEERTSLALETTPTWCFRRTKDKNVLQPGANPTRLQKEILPPNGCIGLWCGRRTLTTGKESTLYPEKLETKTPPNRLLLSNVHSYRMKLWHLWERTTSHNEVTRTLATILRVDKRTIYHPHWPHQPLVLESTPKP